MESHLIPSEESRKITLSALQLLNRQPNKSYLLEWTQIFAAPKKEEEQAERSMIIFRLANEWLTLSTKVFSEIISYKKIHKIPHRSNEVLLGLVNLRGQLNLCIDMHRLLEINSSSNLFKKELSAPQRMIALQNGPDKWIFPVDEVYGIFHWDLSRLKNIPVTVAKSTANYFKGVIEWDGKSIGYLDEELVFYSLRRSLL